MSLENDVDGLYAMSLVGDSIQRVFDNANEICRPDGSVDKAGLVALAKCGGESEFDRRFKLGMDTMRDNMAKYSRELTGPHRILLSQAEWLLRQLS